DCRAAAVRAHCSAPVKNAQPRKRGEDLFADATRGRMTNSDQKRRFNETISTGFIRRRIACRLRPVKIISWNVNGLRAVLRKNFLDYLNSEQPDILCLQETKCR